MVKSLTFEFRLLHLNSLATLVLPLTHCMIFGQVNFLSYSFLICKPGTIIDLSVPTRKFLTMKTD